MTAVLLSTQLAMMMQLDSSSPEIIGSFLLIFTELVFFIILSDTQPPKKDTNSRGQERPGGEETHVKPWEVAFVSQISREPCQEENQRGVTGKLTKAGADDLPAAQQTFRIMPVERDVFIDGCRIFYADILQLFFICRF